MMGFPEMGGGVDRKIYPFTVWDEHSRNAECGVVWAFFGYQRVFQRGEVVCVQRVMLGRVEIAELRYWTFSGRLINRW